MNVVIYCRVSTVDQNPENQLVELKEHVSNHKDYVLVDTYEEKISGTKTTRPQLDRLLQDARLHRFEHVIFWKVDRLGRNTLHLFQIIDEWKKLGITFSVTTLGIDTSTTMGSFVFGLLAQVAELERAFIVERTNLSIKNIKKKLAKGKYKAKSGRVITMLGRPKGSKDKHQRQRRGYFLREYPKNSHKKWAPQKMTENPQPEK
jgi:DNA invertase Pin-like site-specific DNA recombinase